ncbi:MAG: hypothetical protein J7M25_10090 [Deltaproteobacteria bacterium]|nr:hypothetical protein [Deltaproteobacteria bacterium]
MTKSNRKARLQSKPEADEDRVARKKVAALAAVIEYMDQETGGLDAQVARPNVWSLAGRQAIMHAGWLLQMRLAK